MSIFSTVAYTTLTGDVVDLPIGVNVRKQFKTFEHVAVTVGGVVTLIDVKRYLNIDHAVQAGINILRDKIVAGAVPGRFKQKKNGSSKYGIPEVGVVLAKSTSRFKGKVSTIAHTLHITYPDIEKDKMSRKNIYLGTQDTWEATYPSRLEHAIIFRRNKMEEYIAEFLSRMPTIVTFVLSSELRDLGCYKDSKSKGGCYAEHT